MPIKKVGVIGPTDLSQLARLLVPKLRPTKTDIERAEARVLRRAALLGRILAEFAVELWVNSETRGVPHEVARSYKEQRGVKLVALVSAGKIPWPPSPRGGTQSFADEVRKKRGWFWANYDEVSRTDVVIMAGVSTGTLSEIGYIGWNLRHQKRMKTPSSLQDLVVVKEFLRPNRLDFPKQRVLSPELEIPVSPILQYVKRVEELRRVLPRLFAKSP